MAYDTKNKKQVACKIYFARNFLTKDLSKILSAVKTEAEVLKKIDHKNIVKVIDKYLYFGNPTIVTELIEGYQLSDLIKKRKIGVNEMLLIVQQLL